VGVATDEGVQVRMLHAFRLIRVRGEEVEGVFEATGNTPHFLQRLASRGITIDPSVFAAGPLPGERSV
jgi:hypothetical protein